MTFELARQIADAVLYEGYVLYPYRASSAKNHARFQFGVLVPAKCARSGSESSSMQTECIVEPAAGEAGSIDLRVRCLQLRTRTPVPEAIREGDDRDAPEGGASACDQAWDEGCERDIDFSPLDLAELARDARSFDVRLAGGREVGPFEAESATSRVQRESWPIEARVTVSTESCGRAVKLRVRIENVTDWPAGGTTDASLQREAVLRRSLVGVHTLIHVNNGAFVSLLEPPEWAADAAASCRSEGTWPVLVGEPGQRDTVLSSPIILYDYPAVAQESQGDFCDATEIDELLALRVMTLTDAEKREARATDPRAREIVDRADSLPPEMFERLHGTIRYPGHAARRGSSPVRASVSEPAGIDPGDGTIEVDGTCVARGSRVRLRPNRRADSMDLFLAGMAARVQGVYHDVDDRVWIAVTVDDDPAADLQEWHGRFLYFGPDEIEPLG